MLRLVAAAFVLILALAAIQLGRAPLWLLIGYLLVGIASIGFYWADKSAAESGRWRVSEATLHGLDLLGGIAGGLVAQALLRHKIRKQSFAAVTWLIALGHMFALTTLAIGLWDFPGYR